MFIRRFHHVPMAPEGDDGAAGGAADPAGAAAGAAGGGSALAAGAGGEGGAPAGGAPAAPAPSVPEKFLVKGQDGSVDHAATALKVSEAYGHLEKRFGSGDAPPADVGGYKVNVPDALKDRIKADELAGNAGFKDFLAKAHGAGLNQRQLDVVVGDFLERSLAMREAGPVLNEADCVAELRQQDGWKSDAEYKAQISTAFNAGKAIFGNDFDGIVKDYGNDARLIRGLASIGKEMAEDRPASPEAQAQLQDNLDQLMNSRAYLNANDPQHAAVMAKVTALTAKMTGSRNVTGGRSHSFHT